VHVNRVLKSLVLQGLIGRDGKSIQIPDFSALAAVAGFDPAYLHLDQAEGKAG